MYPYIFALLKEAGRSGRCNYIMKERISWPSGVDMMEINRQAKIVLDKKDIMRTRSFVLYGIHEVRNFVEKYNLQKLDKFMDKEIYFKGSYHNNFFQPYDK